MTRLGAFIVLVQTSQLACGSAETANDGPVPILATTATGSGTTGGGAIAGTVGAPCDEDADCGAGIRCISAFDRFPMFDGGPAAGYCSPDCTSDLDCGPGGRCLDDGGVRACFLTCTLGEPPKPSINDELDPAKCRGREDVACDPYMGEQLLGLTPPEGVCNPMCSSHLQCPPGRFCRFRTGKCVDTAPMGLSTGEECNTACEGVCMNAGTQSFCTRYCVLGGPEGTWLWECDAVPPVGEGSFCNFHFGWFGAGDLGACIPACTSQSECINPSLWCAMTVFGSGACKPAPACPNGQATCDAFTMVPNTVCTDTPYGPYCLDPAFPLDSGAGGSAG